MTAATVTVSVLYFAQAQEGAGTAAEHVELAASISADAVLASLGERHPRLAGLLPRCRLALDHAFVSGPLRLTAASELAVIPPVSGG